MKTEDTFDLQLFKIRRHGTEAYVDGTPYPKRTEATLEEVGLPFNELRESGLLWLINRVVFHPRGLALALHVENGVASGWSLQGDGKECWTFTNQDDDEGFDKVNRTIAKYLETKNVGA